MKVFFVVAFIATRASLRSRSSSGDNSGFTGACARSITQYHRIHYCAVLSLRLSLCNDLPRCAAFAANEQSFPQRPLCNGTVFGKLTSLRFGSRSLMCESVLFPAVLCTCARPLRVVLAIYVGYNQYSDGHSSPNLKLLTHLSMPLFASCPSRALFLPFCVD